MQYWYEMKKVFILCAAALVVILVVIISFFVSGKSANAPGTLIPAPTVTSFNNQAPSGAQNQVIRQTTEHYSIGIPNTFTANVSSNTSGGKTLVMTPKEQFMKNENVSISVQETDASLSSLQKQKDIFNTLSNSSREISLGGIPAVKYTTKIPLPSGQNLFETVILFQKGTIVYQVRLGYQGSSINQGLENTFDTVVANFSVN